MHDDYQVSPEEMSIAREVLRAVAAWGVDNNEAELVFVRSGARGCGYVGLVSEWADRYARNDDMRRLCGYVVSRVPRATWFMLEEAICYVHAKSTGMDLKPVGVTFTPEIKRDPGTNVGRYKMDYGHAVATVGETKQYELDALAVFDAVHAWSDENPGLAPLFKVPRQPNREGKMVAGIVIGSLSKWASTFAENDAALQLCARVTRLVPQATYVQLMAALDLVYKTTKPKGE